MPMPDETLHDRAAFYATGHMTPEERAQFELVIEFHHDLREFTTGLMEVAAAVTLASVDQRASRPSPALRARILASITAVSQQSGHDGLVVSGPDGFIHWVNPAFSAMCGYSLEELSGKKPGPILQGEKTDRATAERMRSAVREHRPCRETILNYHKNGTAYWVEIDITPILNDAGQPLWLIARERELTDRMAA